MLLPPLNLSHLAHYLLLILYLYGLDYLLPVLLDLLIDQLLLCPHLLLLELVLPHLLLMQLLLQIEDDMLLLFDLLRLLFDLLFPLHLPLLLIKLGLQASLQHNYLFVLLQDLLFPLYFQLLTMFLLVKLLCLQDLLSLTPGMIDLLKYAGFLIL